MSWPVIRADVPPAALRLVVVAATVVVAASPLVVLAGCGMRVEPQTDGTVAVDGRFGWKSYSPPPSPLSPSAPSSKPQPAPPSSPPQSPEAGSSPAGLAAPRVVAR